MQKREVGIWKRLLALVLAAMLSFTLSIPALAANTSFFFFFANFWAYDAIQSAVSKGITNGYADGTFKPGSSVTNAHFAAFLARAFYPWDIEEGAYLRPYEKKAWYENNIYALEKHDVLDGTVVGKNFDANINQPISRYDMAQMMYNVLVDQKVELPSVEKRDAARSAINDWESVPVQYQSAVAACYAMGVLNGQSDGNFGGKNPMNRAQGCVVVYRLTQKINGEETPSQPAMPEEVEQPTTPEQPSKPSYGTQTLTNGKAVTEENVSELLEELKTKYPNKGYYDPYNPSYYFEARGTAGVECAKLAFMLSDEIFGKDAPIRSHTDYNNIKLGDIIELRDENGQTYHWNVVNEIGLAPSMAIYLKTTDGGPSGVISWKGTYYTNKFDYERIWTRYPESYDDDIRNGLAEKTAYMKALEAQEEAGGEKEMRCANCGFLMRKPGGEINPNGNSFGECPTCHNWYLCGQCFSSTAMQQHMDRCTG